MSLFLSGPWRSEHPKLNGRLKWVVALLAAGASFGALQFQVFNNTSELEDKVDQQVFEAKLETLNNKLDLLIDHLLP